MILKNDELFHEFYSLQSHKYPAVNLQQMKEAAFSPWIFTRLEMESGNLEEIRLKYFGSFQVYPGRAKSMLENIKKRHQFNKIDPTQFFKLKDMLEKFIKDNNE